MGERLLWEEIVKKYPDRWVALVDYERNGAIILSGIPVRACIEDDIYSNELELEKEGVDFMWVRTTELEGANVFI